MVYKSAEKPRLKRTTLMCLYGKIYIMKKKTIEFGKTCFITEPNDSIGQCVNVTYLRTFYYMSKNNCVYRISLNSV